MAGVGEGRDGIWLGEFSKTRLNSARLGVGPWRSDRRQRNRREQGRLPESTGIFRKQGGFLWLEHEVHGTEW